MPPWQRLSINDQLHITGNEDAFREFVCDRLDTALTHSERAFGFLFWLLIVQIIVTCLLLWRLW